MPMRLFLSFFCACLIVCCLAMGEDAPAIERLDPAMGVTDAEGGLIWYDVKPLGLEGQGWTDLAHPYDRLPARAEGVVTGAVWSLSRNSAGMAVRFVCDSPTLAARWSLRSDRLAMPHMPATGVSGLDLYARTEEGGWRWLGDGRPSAAEGNETTLAGGIPAGMREYLLYLPLYNGVESVELGVTPEATLGKAPARPADHAKPVLVWGTSIVQGGCASRTGMAYPAILGRMLDRPFINLGFSGNGKMDPELAEMLGELDVASYVIDCCPNMSPELITERTEPMVRTLRAARPDVPIVLVENIEYQAAWLLPGARSSYQDKNTALRAAYERLVADGLTGLHYVPGGDLLGHDGEGTVDGTHATDLGFLRMAEVLAPVLRSVLP